MSVSPQSGAEKRSCGPSLDEVAIGFVEDQRDAAPPAQSGEGGDGRRRIDGARRIVRRHQDDGARAGIDQALGLPGVGHEAPVGIAWQDSRLDAEHVERHLVIEVPGAGQQHIGAGRRDRHGGDEEGLVAAGGDRHVGRREAGGAVEIVEMAQHRPRATPHRQGSGRRTRLQRHRPRRRAGRAGRHGADSPARPATGRSAGRHGRDRRPPSPAPPELAG